MQVGYAPATAAGMQRHCAPLQAAQCSNCSPSASRWLMIWDRPYRVRLAGTACRQRNAAEQQAGGELCRLTLLQAEATHRPS